MTFGEQDDVSRSESGSADSREQGEPNSGSAYDAESVSPADAAVSTPAPTSAARDRLAAALDGLDLTPESTQDDIDLPGTPPVEPLLRERPPHHLPPA